MAHNLAQLAFSHHNHVWSKQMQPHIDALILSNVNMDCLVESNSVFAYKKNILWKSKKYWMDLYGCFEKI